MSLKMKKKPRKDLLNGSVRRHLFSLTWPMLFGLMGIVVFNLVDTYFVGKLGLKELAAMSFTFPVIMFLNSISQGVGIGTSSLISRHIVHSSHDAMKMMASRALLLGLLAVCLFVVAGLFTIRPLFRALGAKGEVLEHVVGYMRIWYLGMPFVVIPMIGNNIVRATGDTFVPGMIMVVNALVNVVLDPLFIFGLGPFPKMGIGGAALATVIARAVGLVCIVFILVHREGLLTVRLGKIRNILKDWKSVLYVAGPASLTLLIVPVSMGVITRIVSDFGKEAVAAFGVASRVEMFALMVIAALGSVLIIFMGQNSSKHRYDRVHEAFVFSSKFSMVWGAVAYLALFIFGRGVASIFANDPAVIRTAEQYFRILGISYGFQGIVMLTSSSFNGLNRPHPSAAISILRMLVLYVPLAWVGAELLRIQGVFWAGLVANVVSGAISSALLWRTIKRLAYNPAPVCR